MRIGLIISIHKRLVKCRVKLLYKYPRLVYLFGINLAMVYIFIGCLIFLSLYECWISNVPAPIEIMIGIGKVFVQVLYATLTGIIFYFFVEHVPSFRRKLAFHLNRQNEAYKIHRFIETVINDLCLVAGKSPGEKISSAEELHLLLNSPNLESHMYDAGPSQRDYNTYITETINIMHDHCNRWLVHSDSLEPEWIVCLTGIEKNILMCKTHSYNGTLLWSIKVFAENLFKMSQNFHQKFRFPATMLFTETISSD
jgi:hypothetical protein